MWTIFQGFRGYVDYYLVAVSEFAWGWGGVQVGLCDLGQGISSLGRECFEFLRPRGDVSLEISFDLPDFASALQSRQLSIDFCSLIRALHNKDELLITQPLLTIPPIGNQLATAGGRHAVIKTRDIWSEQSRFSVHPIVTDKYGQFL